MSIRTGFVLTQFKDHVRVFNPLQTATRLPLLTWRRYRTKSKASKPDERASDAKNKPSKSSPLITPGSEHHNDLKSFLRYANETGLKTTSTVYVGTHYEYVVRDSLRQLGFDLTRTGRGNDYGIDLLGHWTVPSLPAHTPLRVLLQCKARSGPLTPNHIRELEGAFAGAPAGWRGDGVLGILVATREATRGVREALRRSSIPLGFVMATADEGKILQFIWNNEASENGLEGMGVTTRYMHDTGSGRGNGDGVEREIALTWNGFALKKIEVKAEEPAEDGKPKKTRRSGKDDERVKRGRPRKDSSTATGGSSNLNSKKSTSAKELAKRPRGGPRATAKKPGRPKKGS